MKIAIGCDHVAYQFKLQIEAHLKAQGIEFVDFGTVNEERTSYPIYATKVFRAVVSGERDKLCGEHRGGVRAGGPGRWVNSA